LVNWTPWKIADQGRALLNEVLVETVILSLRPAGVLRFLRGMDPIQPSGYFFGDPILFPSDADEAVMHIRFQNSRSACKW